MRHRATIFNPGSFHDDLIQNLNSTNFKIVAPSLQERFSIENKFTIPISKPLQYIRQLRIQSKRLYDDVNLVFPFDFTTGLNVYVLPRNTANNDDNDEFFNELNSVLKDVVNVDINATEWITAGNSLYYYSSQPASIHPQSTWFQYNDILDYDSTFDLVYNSDDSSKQIVLRQLLTDVAEIDYSLKLGDYKEIGLFLHDVKVSQTKDDLVLSGLRVILDGQSESDDTTDKDVHKTMFHLKPRHRYLPGSVSSSIIPQGLHPILATTITTENDLTSTINQEIIGVDDDVQACNGYFYLNLNKSLIFDKYQDIPQNTTLLVDNGVSNLELPEYNIEQWGSELLFQVSNDEQSDVSLPAKFDLNLTLHSRYQLPNNSDTSSPFTEIINPQPQFFIACKVKEGDLLSRSPFDSKRLTKLGNNYEAYFEKDTVFYHFKTESDRHLLVDIPHGTTTFDRVNSITTFTLFIGIGIIFWGILQRFTKSKTSQKSKTE